MVRAAAALVLALAAPPQHAPPTLPPGVVPLRAASDQRVHAALEAALAEIGPAQYAPPPKGAAPAPGSATESEALRRYVRSQVRQREGQEQRAGDDLDAALRLDPTSAALHAARAAAASDAGDLARAVSEWEAVLSLEPTNGNAAVSVGLVALETGQPQRAASLLGPLWLSIRAGAAHGLNESGRFALGATLARALARLGYDQAALAPAQWALDTNAERMASERGDGADAAIRAFAALAKDAGEMAIRAEAWETARALLLRSVHLVPETRAMALAAYASIVEGNSAKAREIAGELLKRGPPETELGVQAAEWLLGALGGDAEVAREMSELLAQEPSDSVVSRLLAAADPDRAAAVLDQALALGAADAGTLRAAFQVLALPERVRVAVRSLRADPSLVRGLSRAIVRSGTSSEQVLSALRHEPPSPEQQALLAGALAFCRSPGAGWSVATAARERWPDEPVVAFAQIEAAAAAADPSLVQNAMVDATELLRSDAEWHAAIARAAQATGLEELENASVARCRELDPNCQSAARVRAAAAGRAPPTTPRGRAEQAVAAGNMADAATALMEARALDPDDDAALGLLLHVLPRVVGPSATLDWIAGELDGTPNDPLLWEALAYQSAAGGRIAEALATVDLRLAADPDDTVALAARESLYRNGGQSEEALAAARERTAALPPGPRKALEQARVESQGGDGAMATDCLRSFAEAAYPPPTAMRASALGVAARLPATAERAAIMRRIARDAILADSSAPLEFFAYEALSAASDPAFDAAEKARYARMIGDEAASAPLHQEAAAAEQWRAACDFLALQGFPAAGAEFLRARLEEPADLPDQELQVLARAAFAADALAGGRAQEALRLLERLRADGRAPLGSDESRRALSHSELSDLFGIAGDAAGSQELLEAAHAIDPEDPVVLNNLAYALAAQGQVGDRTLAMATSAVKGKPGEAAYLDTLGWVLYLRGQVQDSEERVGALTLLGRAVKAAGSNASAEMLIHLGDAQWQANDHPAAVISWRSAVRRAMLLDRQSTVGLYRNALRQRTALSAVDPERYYAEHDAAPARSALARLAAADSGAQPPIGQPKKGAPE